MKIYSEGERSQAVCKSCKSKVSTTFSICRVPYNGGKGFVEDVLAATCNNCGSIVSIPQQSVPRIKETLHSKKHSIEVRIPRHLLDILLLASDRFEFGNPELLKDYLVRYYIGVADSDKEMINNIKKFSTSDFAKGSGFRLSLKVNDGIQQRFIHLMKVTSLTKTQILKGIILQINEDILQSPTKKKLAELEKVLLAAG